MSTTLTGDELARLEELAEKVCLPFETFMGLGVGCPSGNGPIPSRICMANNKGAAAYIAAACNAVPQLVAEVRRLREENAEVRADMVAVKTKWEPCDDCWTMKTFAREMGITDMHWFYRDACARLESMKQAEAENAALRERVEALEWLVECMDNYEWCCNRSGWFIAHGVHHEAKATLEAAREAIS